MCGIIGYTGPRPAAPILLDSLRRLEYRGYDSAGIAIIDADGDVATVKNTNKVVDLARQVEAEGTPSGSVGIGHTRWATHGRPSLENAHPHQDCTGRIHVIHNGIVENYRELRAELMARGHEFLSETDTEVVPHLIEDAFRGDLASAVRSALNRMQGACALVVISADQPDRVVGARMNAPLVVGLGRGEVFVSSDITALIPYTKRIALLGEGEIVTATPDGISVQQLDGTAVEARVVTVDWEAEQAQKNGYPHFLLKEIHEQPEAVRNALRGRIDDLGMVVLPELGVSADRLAEVHEVVLVACGSAWYAAMVAGYAIEHLAKIRCKVEAASEFRYGEALVDEHSLVVAVSQSGETADTLAAVRQAHQAGAQVIAITNVVGSALPLEADGALYMQAGSGDLRRRHQDLHDPDGVRPAARTPARRRARHARCRPSISGSSPSCRSCPTLLARTLELEPMLVDLGQRFAHTHSALYIGRGINFPIAMEGALKLKEISYVHAEGYAAGELKHGPIALLEPEVPVIAIATRSATLPKMVSNVQEVHSRDAPVIALVTEGEDPFDAGFATTIPVPALLRGALTADQCHPAAALRVSRRRAARLRRRPAAQPREIGDCGIVVG